MIKEPIVQSAILLASFISEEWKCRLNVQDQISGGESMIFKTGRLIIVTGHHGAGKSQMMLHGAMKSVLKSKTEIIIESNPEFPVSFKDTVGLGLIPKEIQKGYMENNPHIIEKLPDFIDDSIMNMSILEKQHENFIPDGTDHSFTPGTKAARKQINNYNKNSYRKKGRK